MTQDSAGIVERLNAIDPYLKHMPHERAVVAEAAAHIEAQAVELEKMREALERFVDDFENDFCIYGSIVDSPDPMLKTHYVLARAALKGTTP